MMSLPEPPATGPRDVPIHGPAFLGAWKKGWRAGYAGEPKRCPYADERTYRGGVTYSRSFIRYWTEGYDAGAQARRDA